MEWALCSVDPETSGALGEQGHEVGAGYSQDAGPAPRDKLSMLGFSF